MYTHLQQTTLMVNEFARSTARLRQLADHQKAIMAHLKLSAHFHASEAMPPEQRVYMDLDWALMTDYRALASALSTLETIDRRQDPMRQGESDC